MVTVGSIDGVFESLNADVMIWVNNSIVAKPMKVCSVTFRGKDVNREEFYNSAAAALELTFAFDTRFPSGGGNRSVIPRTRHFHRRVRSERQNG